MGCLFSGRVDGKSNQRRGTFDTFTNTDETRLDVTQLISNWQVIWAIMQGAGRRTRRVIVPELLMIICNIGPLRTGSGVYVYGSRGDGEAGGLVDGWACRGFAESMQSHRREQGDRHVHIE